MELIPDDVLENSAVVANCRMNRERNLYGNNGYDVELRFDPMAILRQASEKRPVRWLDLCCGTARALGEAADIIAAEELPVEIVGVDLVGMFIASRSKQLSLVKASLTNWEPDERFDLITCVHGLHYLGDKLSTITRVRSWLTESGRFTANMDMANIKIRDRKTSRVVGQSLRGLGFEISTAHKLIECHGHQDVQLPFEYLGADDQAGPNYTGQPAVDSHYQMLE